MKRSEMIKIIEEELQKFLNLDEYTENGTGNGAKFLDRLEKAGMLPPLVTYNYYNTILTPPTRTPSGNLDYSLHKANEWEKE